MKSVRLQILLCAAALLVEEPSHIEARLALAKVLIGLYDLPTAEKELT